jgi:hypothetical protein
VGSERDRLELRASREDATSVSPCALEWLVFQEPHIAKLADGWPIGEISQRLFLSHPQVRLPPFTGSFPSGASLHVQNGQPVVITTVDALSEDPNLLLLPGVAALGAVRELIGGA